MDKEKSPYHSTIAEEITWHIHINDRERVSPYTVKQWRKEAEGIIIRVLAKYGFDATREDN